MDLIGIITFLVGGLCLCFGPRFSSFAVLIASLLGSSAALTIGGASLQPAYILLGFVLVDLATRPKLVRLTMDAVTPFQPAFWLMLAVVYGTFASIIMPRLFAGATYVFAIGHAENGTADTVLTPLAPVSGNVTQPLYFIAGFLCYLTFLAYGKRERNLSMLAQAMLACALMDIVFALLDLLTYLTNTTGLLAFVRNAGYRMLVEAEVDGVKRIVGFFPEASSFAGATIGLFAATLNLWMYGIYSRWSGLAALGCFLCLIFCTSSSGYFGLAIFVGLQYALCLIRVVTRSAPRRALTLLVFAPLLLGGSALAIYLHAPTREAVSHLIDATVYDKLDSDSGIERSAWNAQALEAFWATYGLGAGVGSVRASSWLVAVLGTMGVFGATTYLLFIFSALFHNRSEMRGREYGIREAARMGCLAQLILSLVAAGSVDLGLEFFSFAAVATATRAIRRRPARAMLSTADENWFSHGESSTGSYGTKSGSKVQLDTR